MYFYTHQWYKWTSRYRLHLMMPVENNECDWDLGNEILEEITGKGKNCQDKLHC